MLHMRGRGGEEERIRCGGGERKVSDLKKTSDEGSVMFCEAAEEELYSERDPTNMLPCRMVLVALLYSCIKTGVTRCRNKDLFPAASRVKRGTAENPTFQSSLEDVHLLFEILMSGAHFDQSGAFSVQDAELASLRKTRNLDVICEHVIPKKLTDVSRLVSDLSDHTCRLDQDDFERILLTLVFTAQQTVGSTNKQRRNQWAESFVSLYEAIKKDLKQTN